jgi:hypothetical protein
MRSSTTRFVCGLGIATLTILVSARRLDLQTSDKPRGSEPPRLLSQSAITSAKPLLCPPEATVVPLTRPQANRHRGVPQTDQWCQPVCSRQRPARPNSTDNQPPAEIPDTLANALPFMPLYLSDGPVRLPPTGLVSRF